MILNRANILYVADLVHVAWDGALQAAEIPFKDFVTILDSKDKEAMSYNWLESLVSPRLWVGERQSQALAARTIQLVNQPYEQTLGLFTEQIRRDTYGQFIKNIQALVPQAMQLWRRLCEQAADAAYTARGYDGQVFLDTHPYPVGGRSYVNLTHNALTYGNVYKGIQYFDTLKMPNGKDPLYVDAFLLMVAPALRQTAEELLTADRQPNSFQSNQLKGRNWKIEINHEWVDSEANDNKWQIHAKSGGGVLTPLALQIEMEPKLSTTALAVASEFSMTAEGETQFQTREIKFGTEQWGAAGLTLPQLLYGSDGNLAAA